MFTLLLPYQYRLLDDQHLQSKELLAFVFSDWDVYCWATLLHGYLFKKVEHCDNEQDYFLYFDSGLIALWKHQVSKSTGVPEVVYPSIYR